MSPDAHLEVIAAPGRRWLLRCAGRTYLVPARLGAQVAGAAATERRAGLTTATDGHRVLALLAAGGPPQPQRRRSGIRLRVPLVPAPLVDRLARRLAPLASWLLLAGQGAAGLLLYRYALDSGPLDGTVMAVGARFWLPVCGWFLATALWHECGHAAALRRGGVPAGGFGAGLLLVLPVFYCDVTTVALLRRRDRLRVDLAGVCFQLLAGGLLAAAGSRVTEPTLRTAGLLALLAVSWSLMPFIRSDGHWALADLLGIADLNEPLVQRHGTGDRGDARGGSPDGGGDGGRGDVRDGDADRPSVWMRLLAGYLVVHRVGEALFVAALAVLLPTRLLGRLHLDGLVSRLRAEGGAAEWPLVIFVVPLVWIWFRLARRLGRLARAGYSDLRTALGAPRDRRRLYGRAARRRPGRAPPG